MALTLTYLFRFLLILLNPHFVRNSMRWRLFSRSAYAFFRALWLLFMRLNRILLQKLSNLIQFSENLVDRFYFFSTNKSSKASIVLKSEFAKRTLPWRVSVAPARHHLTCSRARSFVFHSESAKITSKFNSLNCIPNEFLDKPGINWQTSPLFKFREKNESWLNHGIRSQKETGSINFLYVTYNIIYNMCSSFSLKLLRDNCFCLHKTSGHLLILTFHMSCWTHKPLRE